MVEIGELSVVECQLQGRGVGLAGAQPQQVTAILLRLDAHHRVAATALLAGLRAHQQPHIGLNGADQGLEMLAFALKAGLLAQVEIPAGEDVELLLRLPSTSGGGDIRQAGEFQTAAGLLVSQLVLGAAQPCCAGEGREVGHRLPSSRLASNRCTPPGPQQKARVSTNSWRKASPSAGSSSCRIAPLRPFMRASTRSL